LRRWAPLIVFFGSTWYNRLVRAIDSASKGVIGCFCGLVQTIEEDKVTRNEVAFAYQLDRTLDRLAHGGLLLASTRTDGPSNVMTIGWATVGVIWGLPVMVVLVRPSRYTYGFIEESKVFTVNVPTSEMSKYVMLCGTRSGRDVDKLAQVETSIGRRVDCVTVDACSMVYECQVVHWNDVQPHALLPSIDNKSYAQGDYHRLYYGQIVGTYSS
jgi:flavin reductase (DIM6/NTAB) family NADH-FMN oxidoreductase RutF